MKLPKLTLLLSSSFAHAASRSLQVPFILPSFQSVESPNSRPLQQSVTMTLMTTATDKRQLTSCWCPESVLWQLGFARVFVSWPRHRRMALGVVVYIGAWIGAPRTNWHDKGNVQPEVEQRGRGKGVFSSGKRMEFVCWNFVGVACRAERIIISFNFYGYFIICCRVVLLSSCTVLLPRPKDYKERPRRVSFHRPFPILWLDVMILFRARTSSPFRAGGGWFLDC